MDKFQAFGKNFSSTFPSWAGRTQQYLKEQIGQADDKTQLPPDYLDLERRVDALHQAYTKMLTVTSQYTHEGYDYPTNLRESFNDLGRTVSEKVNLVRNATSPAEVQSAFTAPPSAKPQPKTFSHAIARASLNSSALLSGERTAAGEDPLATALEKFAIASEKLGEARLAQDGQIKERFLDGWNTTLKGISGPTQKARNEVEKARLDLDNTRATAKNPGFQLPGQPKKPELDDSQLSEEARTQIERKEDTFVEETEKAVNVMKGVLDTPEPLRNLANLIAAQLEYHKKAYEILSELAPVVDQLQVEQEGSYRESRREPH